MDVQHNTAGVAEDLSVEDLKSVGSCDSDLRDVDDQGLENLSFERMYMSTHAGTSLSVVLNELMEEGDINVIQKSELERQFSRIYHESFSQCQSKLHLSIHAKLDEYSVVENGAQLNMSDCVINGPSSSIRVPKGEARLTRLPTFK